MDENEGHLAPDELGKATHLNDIPILHSARALTEDPNTCKGLGIDHDKIGKHIGKGVPITAEEVEGKGVSSRGSSKLH